MSRDDADQFFMLRALAEADRGRGAVEPNPMVGAAVVRDGRLIAVGHHERYGGPHAEVHALRVAGDAARGATLYATLEPCCHHGKTPPCTDAVLASGVARVVVAMTDPFPRVSGQGVARLRAAGVAVDVGVEAPAARRLNASYLKRIATGRPFVTAKWAMTLDGKIATARGDSKWISGERSRAMVHETRGLMDAVLVGIGTAMVDDPMLTARPPGPRLAARVVLDSAARLPLDSRLVATARDVPVTVFVSDAAPAARRDALVARGCRIVAVPTDGRGLDAGAVLDALGRDGATNVLVEGGSRVLGSFFAAGEVDEIDVFLAPVVEGGAESLTPVAGPGFATIAEALRVARPDVSVLDGDVRVRGRTPWGEAHARPDSP